MPDRRTQTTIIRNGAVSDVHSGTVSESHGINVNSDQTDNMQVPNGGGRNGQRG
jgi:hypothetical protein